VQRYDRERLLAWLFPFDERWSFDNERDVESHHSFSDGWSIRGPFSGRRRYE
jgi:hypothetical protein